MFINCPHCKALVATDPVSGAPPAACPRCGVGLRDEVEADAGDTAGASAQVAAVVPATDDGRSVQDPDTAVHAESEVGAAEHAAPDVQVPAHASDDVPAARNTDDNDDNDVRDGATVGADRPTVARDMSSDPAAADHGAPAAGSAAAGDLEGTLADGAHAPRDAAITADPDPSTMQRESGDGDGDDGASPAAAPEAAPVAQPPDPAGIDAGADAIAVPRNADADTPARDPAPSPAPAPATAQRRRTDAPSFARLQPARTPVDRRRRWLKAGAIAGLLLLLAVQLLVADRARLAEDARWRPTLSLLCGAMRCALPPWHEPSAFTLLGRDVRTHPRTPGALRVTASFRNDARWPQPWPALQLTLSDVDGREAATRVFAPREYLGGAPTQSGLGSGQATTVAFDIVEPSPHIVAFTFDFR